MSALERGWAFKSGRTFLFRYVASGFLVLSLILFYLALFFPTTAMALSDLDLGAEALAGLILILAGIMLGSLIRGVSIDPWKIFDWHFRPECRKVGDIA